MEKLIALALEKTSAKNAKGIKLEAGLHEVDATLTVHILGTVEKKADESYVPTVDIPLKSALALVLEKSGITREASSKILVEAMREALNADEKADESLKERLNDIDAAMSRVNNLVGALPKKNRSGKTFVKCSLEVLEPALA